MENKNIESVMAKGTENRVQGRIRMEDEKTMSRISLAPIYSSIVRDIIGSNGGCIT
jgi:hypothetical protein